MDYNYNYTILFAFWPSNIKSEEKNSAIVPPGHRV